MTHSQTTIDFEKVIKFLIHMITNIFYQFMIEKTNKSNN